MISLHALIEALMHDWAMAFYPTLNGAGILPSI
jgi:hypothetical protein